ncbi:MAG: homoserine dehydrogenase [Synergistales bacterium]|nr:homoserine dehydrogenase [Synergistales bacterium]
MKFKILLLGFGNVGKGFCRLLSEKRKILKENYGIDPSVVGICTRTRGNVYDPGGIDLTIFLNRTERTPLIPLKEMLGSKVMIPEDPSVEELVSKADYDVLAECTLTSLDGGEPAYGWMKKALERGRSVITTNKGPIAFHYPELHELELKHGSRLLFEGTVMAGTPVFATFLQGLSGSRIQSFEGVLNGTCNYILELMQQGKGYGDALEKAREAGYAEADPAMDVEGYDSALKALILSNVLTKKSVPFEKIELQGIRAMDPGLIEQARSGKGKIRLVARGRLGDNNSDISVKPEVLLPEHPLYNLPGAMNGLVFNTDTVGQVYISGKGAGSRETGFALLSDLIALFPGKRHFHPSVSVHKEQLISRRAHLC